MSSGRIDRRTQQVAKKLCNAAQTVADYPFEIEGGGGFVPAWAMYVSAAIAVINACDMQEEIKKIK